MKKRIIFCQVWEWYGSEDFKVGRYKAKGGAEFIFDATPESEAIDEDDLIDRWNASHNLHGQGHRYEAKRIDFYWEPQNVGFVNGEFVISNNQ
jgi:hypothetical protein